MLSSWLVIDATPCVAKVFCCFPIKVSVLVNLGTKFREQKGKEEEKRMPTAASVPAIWASDLRVTRVRLVLGGC